jgi:Uri superfamily endonuclease
MTSQYERGKIYRINCPDDYYYIGSTISDLGRIITTMKRDASDPKKQCNLYRYFQSIGWNPLTIECIELYPCQSKKELNERELHHIHSDDLHCLNNSNVIDNLPIENKEEQSTIIGFIYKLVCPDGYYYISCTIIPLIHRIQNHKQHAKTSKLRVYTHINTIGWDDITIELIETYTCSSKKELNAKMNSYIENHNNDSYCLNDEIKKKEDTKNIKEIISEEPSTELTDNDRNVWKTGKIYKLLCKDSHFYIGSTVQTLQARLNRHINSSIKGTSRAYQYINSIGWDNVHIELIEDYPCNTMKELHEREDMYIQLMQNDDNCLNENRAHLLKEEKLDNMKQYYQEHKEEITEYQQKYRAEHNETINQKFAEYRKKNAELLAEKQRAYAQQNKEKIKTYKKTYDETHKEELAETYRIYRLKNKEKIVKRQREWAQKKKEENAEVIAHERAIQKQERQEKSQKRIDYDNIINTCECGGTYQNYRKSRHLASKKHLAFMNNS